MGYLVVSKKKNPLLCEDGIENSVSLDLVMPINNPWDGFLYPTLTLMMDS